MQMDLEFILDKVKDITKNIGETIIKELNDYMDNKQLTDDFEVELEDKKREILKNYDEIYEVKDRGVYKYSKEEKYPEFSKERYIGQENGFYILNDNNELFFDRNLNDEINKKFNEAKCDIIKEQNTFLNNCRIEGEEYEVDELGDDEKCVYLTRKKDGLEFQDLKITNSVYESIKEMFKEKKEPILIWNGEEYIIK